MTSEPEQSGPPPTPQRHSLARLGLSDEGWKVAAAALIGIVSLTGAFLTYQGVRMGEEAVDIDRRAVTETAAVEQERSDAAVRVAAEAASAARYQALLAEADVLEELSTDPGLRDDRSDRVRMARTLATSVAATSFDPTFLVGDGDDATYDTAGRMDALLRQNPDIAQLDPDRTAAEADAAHRDSVRLIAWVVPLVALIGVLSLAQLSRPRRRPPLVIGSGVVLLFVIVGSVVQQ